MTSVVLVNRTGNGGLHKIAHNISLMAVCEGPGKCEERNEKFVNLPTEARKQCVKTLRATYQYVSWTFLFLKF